MPHIKQMPIDRLVTFIRIAIHDTYEHSREIIIANFTTYFFFWEWFIRNKIFSDFYIKK